jgi:RNA polymerase sigma-70 factor, ECF subfamily
MSAVYHANPGLRQRLKKARVCAHSWVVQVAETASVPTFPEVFRAHAGFAWRVLKNLGVREADVEDVCQEVFVVVHRKLPEFEGRSSVKTWIYAICIRTASDYRRRAHVRREALTDEVPDERISAPQIHELERRRAKETLDRALDGLDDDKRAVFVLFEVEKLSMHEVAAAVDCPLQTAYSRLYAARRAIAAHFEPEAP